MARRPRLRRPAPLRGARAEHARRRGGAALRRARPGRRRLHRLHVRPRRGRLRPPADPGRRGRRRDRRRRRSRGISPITMACFDAIKATSPRNDDAGDAPRARSTARRDGFVLGEGAAVLVLEELEHARARGAHVYGEIAGYAEPRQRVPHDRAAARRRSRWPRRSRDALRQGGTDPDDIDYINAHGSGTQAERPARDGGVQARARRARVPRPGQLDQVDGRPLARRRSARSRSPPARWPSSTASSRRRPTCTTPTRSATSTTCRWRRARAPGRRRAVARAAASAASSPRWSWPAAEAA